MMYIIFIIVYTITKTIVYQGGVINEKKIIVSINKYISFSKCPIIKKLFMKIIIRSIANKYEKVIQC